MSSDSTGSDREPQPNQSGKRLHIWGRPIEPPAPSTTPTTPTTEGKALSGDDFQKNFPETQGISISDAFKTVKPEDMLQVHKSVCGRQGLLTGIAAGAIIGGLRFVWRGEYPMNKLRDCYGAPVLNIPSVLL